MVAHDESGSIRDGCDHQVYLKYLDKEMTIMGILSAFAVIAPSVILDRTFGASSLAGGASLWSSQPGLISLASAMMFLAALFFYRQRSDLALTYGQIAISLTPSAYDSPTTGELVHDSDRWSAWKQYFRGFGFVALAFACYVQALVAYEGWLTVAGSRWITLLLFGSIALWFFYRQRLFHRYDNEYNPWECHWQAFRARWMGPAFRRG
jgi:hypothetical protein